MVSLSGQYSALSARSSGVIVAAPHRWSGLDACMATSPPRNPVNGSVESCANAVDQNSRTARVARSAAEDDDDVAAA